MCHCTYSMLWRIEASARDQKQAWALACRDLALYLPNRLTAYLVLQPLKLGQEHCVDCWRDHEGGLKLVHALLRDLASQQGHYV